MHFRVVGVAKALGPSSAEPGALVLLLLLDWRSPPPQKDLSCLFQQFTGEIPGLSARLGAVGCQGLLVFHLDHLQGALALQGLADATEAPPPVAIERVDSQSLGG